MLGTRRTYANIPRDRLVTICQSSDKANVFDSIVNKCPQVSREILIEQMTYKGIDDSQRILKDIDDYIEIHNQGLSSAMSILGL